MKLFGAYGELTDAFVAQRGGKPRGFGFVRFADPEAAKKACAGIHGMTVGKPRDRRQVRVMFARARDEDEHAYNTVQKGNVVVKPPESANVRPRRGKRGEKSGNSRRRGPPSETKAYASQKSGSASGMKWGEVVKKKTSARASENARTRAKPKSASDATSRSRPKPKSETTSETRAKVQQPVKVDAKVNQSLPPHPLEAELRRRGGAWNPSELDLRKALLVGKGPFSGRLDDVLSYIAHNGARLRKMNVSHNGLSDDALIRVCEATASSGVTHLNLSHNDMTATGARALASLLSRPDCRVQELNLSFNRLCSQGMRRVAEALGSNRSVRVLYLERNYLDNQATEWIGKMITSNRTIGKIDLSRSLFDSDDGINRIRDALASNATLKYLRMRRCALGPRGASALAEAMRSDQCGIVDLDIQFNRVGINGAAAIGEMLALTNKLVSLNVQYNGVGAEGTRRLVEGLDKNTSLRSLDLSYNLIKDDGARLIYKALKKPSSGLIRVNLEENFISPDGKAKIKSLTTEDGKTRDIRV